MRPTFIAYSCTFSFNTAVSIIFGLFMSSMLLLLYVLNGIEERDPHCLSHENKNLQTMIEFYLANLNSDILIYFTVFSIKRKHQTLSPLYHLQQKSHVYIPTRNYSGKLVIVCLILKLICIHIFKIYRINHSQIFYYHKLIFCHIQLLR